MKLTKKQEKDLQELLENSNLEMDLEYYIQNSEAEDMDELHFELSDSGAFTIEIIGWYNAIEYLKNNDYSLQNSIELAVDYGYETKDINSELLASLLATNEEKMAFNEINDKLDNILFNN